MENLNIFFPTGKEIGGNATHATPGRSLRERLAAARKVKPDKPFDYESHLTDAVHAIPISPMDVSAEKRRRSYQLEEQIHDAWGENRQADFIRLVDEWRRIFT